LPTDRRLKASRPAQSLDPKEQAQRLPPAEPLPAARLNPGNGAIGPAMRFRWRVEALCRRVWPAQVEACGYKRPV